MGKNKTAGVKPNCDDARLQLEGVTCVIANLMHYTKRCVGLRGQFAPVTAVARTLVDRHVKMFKRIPDHVMLTNISEYGHLQIQLRRHWTG